jgi:uncharacterized protein YcfJ
MKKIFFALVLTGSTVLFAQDMMGGIFGGAIGGVIGNQFGSGAGKTAATIGGAALGAMIGSDDQRGYQGNNYNQDSNTYSRYNNGYATRVVYREVPQVIYSQPRVVYVNSSPVYYRENDREHEWHGRYGRDEEHEDDNRGYRRY